MGESGDGYGDGFLEVASSGALARGDASRLRPAAALDAILYVSRL